MMKSIAALMIIPLLEWASSWISPWASVWVFYGVGRLLSDAHGWRSSLFFWSLFSWCFIQCDKPGDWVVEMQTCKLTAITSSCTTENKWNFSWIWHIYRIRTCKTRTQRTSRWISEHCIGFSIISWVSKFLFIRRTWNKRKTYTLMYHLLETRYCINKYYIF